MKIEVNMNPKNEFQVSAWWATSPDFVLESLGKQLALAQAIWPKLKKIQLADMSTVDDLHQVLAK